MRWPRWFEKAVKKWANIRSPGDEWKRIDRWN